MISIPEKKIHLKALELAVALRAMVDAFDNDVHMPSAYSEARKTRVAVGYGEASAMARAKALLAEIEK